jgi:hypothetical protein
VTDCYVYYRVDPAREAAARTALAVLLADLEATDGIHGRAFRKVQEPLLWMEVYSGLADPDAVMDRVDALAHKHGLAACLAENQRRHVEHFRPLGEPGAADSPANPGI